MSTQKPPKGLVIVNGAAADLLRGEDLKTVLIAPSASEKPNPAYISAPYDVSFLFVGRQPRFYSKLNRKRRLKWRRRQVRIARRLHSLPQLPERFEPEKYHGELDLLMQGFPMQKFLHPTVCPGCRNVIDPEVCWCGDIPSHHPIDHSFVPMGCDCGRFK